MRDVGRKERHILFFASAIFHIDKGSAKSNESYFGVSEKRLPVTRTIVRYIEKPRGNEPWVMYACCRFHTYTALYMAKLLAHISALCNVQSDRPPQPRATELENSKKSFRITAAAESLSFRVTLRPRRVKWSPFCSRTPASVIYHPIETAELFAAP